MVGVTDRVFLVILQPVALTSSTVGGVIGMANVKICQEFAILEALG